MSKGSNTPNHGKLARRMLLISVAMFGFGYALVPLYNVFCLATGLNGKTGGPAVGLSFKPDAQRVQPIRRD